MATSKPILYSCVDNLLSRGHRNLNYRLFVLIMTFLCYVGYHQSRKPISVVKGNFTQMTIRNPNWCNWPPFNKANWSQLLGSLDYAYLFAYALGMFVSGHLAERLNLRRFLSFGMILSGLATIAFGMAYFLRVKSITYFLVVQIFGGIVQSSGWPSVVTLMGNWFGKGKRGIIMGLWNSHTSVGNILGSVLAGVFVSTAWGWSFVVPGLLILGMGIIAGACVVVEPGDIDCEDTKDKQSLLNEGFGEEEGRVEMPVPEPKKNWRSSPPKIDAISIVGALRIPGVVSFALVLFFAKLVSYTFLYWLPNYIKMAGGLDPRQAADLSTLFDLGGIFGGVVAGAVSDLTGASATVCCFMLFFAIPMMYLYQLYGAYSTTACISLLFVTGFLVNGPYALITTAVSADLGTHKSLRGRAHALATVTAIIDGTGSMGAALGPLLTGLIVPYGWEKVFYMLITANLVAFLICQSIVMHGEELTMLSRRWPNNPIRVQQCRRLFALMIVGAVLMFAWRLLGVYFD